MKSFKDNYKLTSVQEVMVRQGKSPVPDLAPATSSFKLATANGGRSVDDAAYVSIAVFR